MEMLLYCCLGLYRLVMMLVLDRVEYKLGKSDLLAVYSSLFNAYGSQHWWPGDTPFEVMVGAILTQNTAWPNVEKAIINLKQADTLTLAGLCSIPHEQLATLIKPSGYFNIKAKRLICFCRFLQEHGGEDGLGQLETLELRRALLGVNGVGPETADDMLLYAFHRPVFVIDAYTRRIFSRLGMIKGDEPYEELRSGFELSLGPDVVVYNEYHALIVRHAKNHCRVKPACTGCCLTSWCAIPLGEEC
ncbi:Endonuclease III [hydrothermal vent metagenome]|uniref:Endonuclease III n=1 Tax=hydrothermal vent metagenome TaxID=652676 RepID=A0A3B1ALQ6_9ZZZZ